MTTYSVRCKHQACRHRRVAKTHPDTYKVVPTCPRCGKRKGWRIEDRAYNRRGLCSCSGVEMVRGVHFPHRTTHPFCDQNPRGYYNQARAQGVAHEEIPAEYGGGLIEEAA